MEHAGVRHTIALFILFFLPCLAWAQIIHIPAQTPEQGKAFSEFNHRMTGVFLMATGILAAAGLAPRKLSVLGRIWPLLFILPGLYLAVMSDPEVWPMGAQSWLEAFQANPEAKAKHSTTVTRHSSFERCRRPRVVGFDLKNTQGRLIPRGCALPKAAQCCRSPEA